MFASGSQGPVTANLVAPTTLRWPATDVGRASTVVPVTLVATGGVTFAGVSLTGAAGGDFVVRSDECSGRTLATGDSCQVWMRFVPTAAGTRLATLRIVDATGQAREVPLQGFAFGGRTRVEMRSDPGDYIGQGRIWSYTFANAEIAAGGGRRVIGFGLDGAEGSWWSRTFAAASGDILVPGRYPNAARYPFNGTGPGLEVSGNGRGCNTLTGEFTVLSVGYWPDGELRSFGVTFVQH